MAEKREMHIENIKRASEIIKGGQIEELIKSTSRFESDVKNIKSALEEKLKKLETARKEKEALAAQAEAVVEVKPAKEEVKVAPETIEEVKEEKPAKVEKKEKPATEVPVEIKEEKKAEKKVEEETVAPAADTVKDEPVVNDKKEEQPAKEFTPPERPSFIVRREVPIRRDDRKPRAEFRPNDKRPPREGFNKSQQGAPQGGFNRGPKPEFNKSVAKKPQGSTFVAPPIVQKDDKRSFSKKKQGGEKQYEDKHVINKRSLIKNQVDIDDFDENKTGYRKFRPVKKAKEKSEVNVIKIEKAVINTEIIPLKVLSEKSV